MNEHGNRRRGIVAAAVSAAIVAVALPVSGALAGGESAPAQAQAQEQQAPRDDSQRTPRDHGDCPDKDGRNGSSSDASVEL